MAANFLIRLAFVAQLLHLGSSTRYLPMVVWHHSNKLLTCKCNWLTIPEIDVFDELQFVCPTKKIAVDLLDGVPRDTANMMENIYQRRWSGKLEDLKDSLENNSFCDPEQSDGKAKLHTCDGKDGSSYTVEFLSKGSPHSYKTGEIVVFFNNGDGTTATLHSKTPKCRMVFIVKMTSGHKPKHDMSYGKCMAPDSCNINDTCKSECNRTSPRRHSLASSVSPTLETSSTVKLSTSGNAAQTTSSTKHSSVTVTKIHVSETRSSGYTVVGTSMNCSMNPRAAGRGRTCDDCSFRCIAYGIPIGIVIGLIIASVCLMLLRGKKVKRWALRHNQFSKKKDSSHAKNPDKESGTQEQGFKNESFSPESSSDPVIKSGFNNGGFEPESPSRHGISPDELDNVDRRPLEPNAEKHMDIRHDNKAPTDISEEKSNTQNTDNHSSLIENNFPRNKELGSFGDGDYEQPLPQITVQPSAKTKGHKKKRHGSKSRIPSDYENVNIPDLSQA